MRQNPLFPLNFHMKIKANDHGFTFLLHISQVTRKKWCTL
uniref:Uncharacterized protein n=1 Tax=Vitis vinifera TaxID=29760 RepID=F6HBY1_VITVI